MATVEDRLKALEAWSKNIDAKLKNIENRIDKEDARLQREIDKIREDLKKMPSAGDIEKCIKRDQFYCLEEAHHGNHLGVVANTGEFFDVRLVPRLGPFTKWKLITPQF